MAFGWLKKAVTAPIGFLSRIANTRAGRVVRTAAGSLIELAAPAPVRRWYLAAKTVLVPVAKLVLPKGATMENKLAKALREIVKTIIDARKKSGLELAMALVPLMLDLKLILDSIHDVPTSEWIPELRAALDELVGEEEGALIGPGEAALVKIDVPYVGLEAISDLIFQAAERAIIEKTGQTN